MTQTISQSITEGKKIPNFSLPATSDQTIALSDLKGKKVVLYFYPKDNTPGCTIESRDFEALKNEFEQLNAIIIGVSRDTIKSHENFRSKQNLSFDLLADTEEKLCTLFDVVRSKSMFGKKVFGIERSTFLIDEAGKLVKQWRKVKARGHAQAVLEYLKNL